MNKVSMISLWFGLLVVSFSACQTKKEPDYQIDTYLKAEVKDSILADVLTYIYVRPRFSDHQTKWETQFRSYYVNLLPKFRILYYYADPQTGIHELFMIRPIKSAVGHKRGVLAKFKLQNGREILDFEEVLNTPALPEETIVERASFLWAEYRAFGHFDRYYLNKDYVEFPDQGCKYDKVRKEWRYDVGFQPAEEAEQEEEKPEVGQ